jgi:hypothetical protein
VVVTVYYRGQVVGNGGSSYVCILDHTSSAGDEPGVGGSWTTYWAVVAAAGTGLTTGDKGDITVSAGGATWTIDNDAVTYAKIQNVSATDRVLGRSTAGAGDIEEITCTAAGRAILDDVDAAAQRTTLGLGTLATQSGTFSGTSSGTNTGDQTITLTGDVTGSGTGSFAATIANDAVTFAKVQNIATDRLLGRDTASSGDTEELTVGGGIEFTGTGGIRTSAFTGDVTKTAGGTVLSIAANAVGESAIANNAVTYAKIQLPSKNYVLIGDDTTTAYKEIESSIDGFALLEGTATSTNFANLGFKSAVNRNISEGTASPTGGADGDIYLQYV